MAKFYNLVLSFFFIYLEVFHILSIGTSVIIRILYTKISR